MNTNDDFRDKIFQNIVALLLILLGLGTWFIAGQTKDSKEICILLIGSGTTLLRSLPQNKKADAVVEKAQEVNIDDSRG